jgi:hypothetical protein
MADSHSITRLVRDLATGDKQQTETAAAELWARYFTQLAELARRHLSPQVRRREDEEDVLQSVYKSFCLRQRRGDYVLNDRDDLWRLLATIVAHKARNAANRHLRKQKRAIGREARDDSALGGEDARAIVDGVPGDDPTPADAAEMAEELHRRMEALGDDTLRRVAAWKLQGYTNEEIASAGMMNCTVRTVERKLALIRKQWEQVD